MVKASSCKANFFFFFYFFGKAKKKKKAREKNRCVTTRWQGTKRASYWLQRSPPLAA